MLRLGLEFRAWVRVRYAMKKVGIRLGTLPCSRFAILKHSP